MKTKVFRFSALLLAVMLVVSLAVPASAEFNSKVRKATVVVASGYTRVDTGESAMFGWGSGFFVGEGESSPTYLVTNYHVIEDYVLLGKGSEFDYKLDWQTTVKMRAKLWVYYDSSTREEAYLVAYDETKDVAILKLASPTTQRLAVTLEVPTESMVGQTIYAVGFPGLADNVFSDATSTWGSTDCTVTSGVMSRLFVESGTGCEKVQIDCTVRPGNSGGPLVNDNGNVIGINTEYVSVEGGTTENIYYAVNISEAITLLKVNNVPYSLSDGTEKAEETEAATEAPTAAATEAPTAAATEAPTAAATEAPTQAVVTEAVPATTETPEPDPNPGLSTGVILAIVGIIAVAIVAVVVVFATRKPKQAQVQQPVYTSTPNGGGNSGAIGGNGTGGFQQPQPQPVRPITTNTAAADPGTTILNQGDGETTLLSRKAAGGTLLRKSNGESIVINQEHFTIGRKRGDVTYCLSGNNAISRKHLEMTVRNGATFVKSLSTSNPTYFNGIEMKAGEEKELHDGDKLTFADEEFVYSKQ